jgi:hypothetical protein
MRTALGPTPWHANSSRSLVSQAAPSVVTPAPTRPRTAGRGSRRDGSSSAVVGSGWVGSFMAASLSGRLTRRLPRHTSAHARDDPRRRENSSRWLLVERARSVGHRSGGGVQPAARSERLLRRLADSLDALGQARWTCPSASTPCVPTARPSTLPPRLQAHSEARRRGYTQWSAPRMRLCPNACPTGRKCPMAKPRSGGIIIRVSGVRVPPPAWKSLQTAGSGIDGGRGMHSATPQHAGGLAAHTG